MRKQETLAELRRGAESLFPGHWLEIGPRVPRAQRAGTDGEEGQGGRSKVHSFVLQSLHSI